MDYLSVSVSIIVIVGVVMYEYHIERRPCQLIIPEEVLQAHILSFLPPTNCLYINKSTTIIASAVVKRLFVLTHYPDDILRSLGGIDTCVNSYCFIDGPTQIVGGIDTVCIDDLPDTKNHVYLGIDRLDRPFAILKYWVGPTRVSLPNLFLPNEYEPISDTPCEQLVYPKQVVVTMFQRYVIVDPFSRWMRSGATMSTWMMGSYYSSRYMPGDTDINGTTLEIFGKLLQGQPILLNGWRRDSLILGITEEIVTSI